MNIFRWWKILTEICFSISPLFLLSLCSLHLLWCLSKVDRENSWVNPPLGFQSPLGSGSSQGWVVVSALVCSLSGCWTRRRPHDGGQLSWIAPALRFCLKAYFTSLCTLNREPGGFAFLGFRQPSWRNVKMKLFNLQEAAGSRNRQQLLSLGNLQDEWGQKGWEPLKHLRGWAQNWFCGDSLLVTQHHPQQRWLMACLQWFHLGHSKWGKHSHLAWANRYTTDKMKGVQSKLRISAPFFLHNNSPHLMKRLANFGTVHFDTMNVPRLNSLGLTSLSAVPALHVPKRVKWPPLALLSWSVHQGILAGSS